MRTQLYIENKEVELTDDVQFLLNKEFEDIQNPTIIINEWSKTVSIPFTEANNRLFGYIYKPERMIANDGTPDSYKQMNIYFDPTKKLDFKLIYNSMLVMEGYAKMNEINCENETGTYNITLFGQLGKIFQEMQKITFDYSTVEPNYLIDCSTYFSGTLNKTTVKSSFESTGQSSPSLTGNFKNYMGFAPNNSFDSVFDYKTFQKNEQISDTFINALTGVSFLNYSGIEPDSAIPNGLLPREIGEYRSYLQQPYVYFNKLFRIFQEKAESITGYTFDLDSEWFNTNNPYWYKLVYLLKKADVENGDSYNNLYDGIYSDTYPQGSQMAIWYYSSIFDYSTPITGNLNIDNIVDEKIPLLNGTDELGIADKTTIVQIKLKSAFWTLPAGARINSTDGLLVTVTLTGENGRTVSQSILVVDENYSGSYSGNIVRTGAGSNSNIDVPNLDYYFTLDKEGYGDYVTMSYSMRWLLNTYPFTGDTQFETFLRLQTSSAIYVKVHGDHWARSNAYFTLNTFWNNEYNIFNEILNYCKMFRIGIFADEFNKTIKFIPLIKYFQDYTIEDWTDKLDLSKDYTVKPISFENKYVLFNYDNNNTKLGKQYKERYGVNYGEKKLITNYNFNDETTSLFKGIKSSILGTDNVLSWTTLYEDKKIIYTFPAETSIHCWDDSKKYVDCFGQYYFHNGTQQFDSSPSLRPIKISDDTPMQEMNDKYFYSQTTNYVDLDAFPDLSLASGTNLCVFNTPQENYTYDSSLFLNKTSIYDNYWNAYINERYNINNKVVTCYLRMNPIDYINFDFNHFITIDGVLYMINKIYDYNIETPESTKVDLITINDISGYTA